MQLLGAALFVAALAVPARAQDQPPVLAAAARTSLSQAEIALWNDPAFQRQFAESYIAEVDIEPRVTQEERENMQEILDLISANNMVDAAALLERELTRNPSASAVYDFTLANINFQQENLDVAAQHYQGAVQKYPKFRRAWKNLGLIYVRQSRFAEAIPALTRVLELGGSDAVTYGLLGYSYSSVENFLAAESAYRMAILMDPGTMDWKLGLARSFFKQERFAEAVALCGQLIETNRDRTDLWLLQANAYIGLNQPLEAAAIFELVDQLGGSTVDTLSLLGDIYVNEELFSLAAAAYTRAMEKDAAEDPERAIRAAKVLAARGAFDETRALLQRINVKYSGSLDDAERKELLKLEGRLAVAAGATEEEVRLLEEIVALDPLDGEALILLGQHSGRAGDVDRAIFYFERAAAIPASEPGALVRHAQLLVGNGKYVEALPLLRRAQQIQPRENVQQFLEDVERIANR